MKFEDLTNLIEEQGKDLLRTELNQRIQHYANRIEERIEYLQAKGYEDNEDIIEDIIEDAALIIRKLRKFKVIV